MQSSKLMGATSAVWLAFAATGCQEQPPPSLMFGAAVEAGAMQVEGGVSPQGTGMLAEQVEVYLRRNQDLLSAPPQARAALDVPAN